LDRRSRRTAFARAALAGLEGRSVSARRYGVRRHYAVPPGPIWSRSIGRSRRRLRHAGLRWSRRHRVRRPRRTALRRPAAPLPAAGGAGGGARMVSEERGAGPLRQRVRGWWRTRPAGRRRVGLLRRDHGEGLLARLPAAEALAEALAAGEPARYVAPTPRAPARALPMIRLLLLLERHPALRRRAIVALGHEPSCSSAFSRSRRPGPAALVRPEECGPLRLADGGGGSLRGLITEEDQGKKNLTRGKKPLFHSPRP